MFQGDLLNGTSHASVSPPQRMARCSSLKTAAARSGAFPKRNHSQLNFITHFSRLVEEDFMSDVAKKSRHRGPRSICSSCEEATRDIDLNRLRTNTRPTIATAAMIVSALMSGAGLSAQSATEPGKVLCGKAAFGDWREDAPGIRRLITLADLPEIAPEEANFVELAPKPADAMPHVLDGFTVEIVATGLAQARVI